MSLSLVDVEYLINITIHNFSTYNLSGLSFSRIVARLKPAAPVLKTIINSFNYKFNRSC